MLQKKQMLHKETQTNHQLRHLKSYDNEIREYQQKTSIITAT